MACAQTGSGKTGGFLFPLILRTDFLERHDNRRSRQARPTTLVLVSPMCLADRPAHCTALHCTRSATPCDPVSHPMLLRLFRHRLVSWQLRFLPRRRNSRSTLGSRWLLCMEEPSVRTSTKVCAVAATCSWPHPDGWCISWKTERSVCTSVPVGASLMLLRSHVWCVRRCLGLAAQLRALGAR